MLVTGGCGFIGSGFIRMILAERPGVIVTNLDALTYAGNPENLADVASHPRYRFVHGDIADASLVASLMADTDICINLAAQTHVDRSITGPQIFTQTNIMGTHVLLEAARNANIRQFVQVSTDEVYGSLPLEAPDQRFAESDALVPSSPYSASKAAADLLALSYHTTYGLPVCVTRCSNNYGPRQYPEKLLPLFILNLLADRPVPLYGDGLNVRDWIHVEDHNRALLAVAERGQPGRIYNIGADCERSNLAITRHLLTHLGKPDTLIQYVTDRPGHDRRYAIDSSRIQQELGWQPAVAFESGLSATVQWYQANMAWVEHLCASKP